MPDLTMHSKVRSERDKRSQTSVFLSKVGKGVGFMAGPVVGVQPIGARF